jgi:hypothetical protein
MSQGWPRPVVLVQHRISAPSHFVSCVEFPPPTTCRPFVHRCVGPMMVRSMKWSLSDIVLNQCRPFSSSRITLDNVLGLGPCASGVSTVGVT